MHHNVEQNSSHKGKRSVQPKSEAWSVLKSSLTRLGPHAPLQPTQKPDDGGALSGTSVKKSKTKSKKKVQKPVPSVVVEKIKANLETDTLQLNSTIKEMLPTVKSLKHPRSPAPASQNPKVLPTLSNEGAAGGLHENVDLALGFVPLPPGGEKLITVGGYIISLQSTREDITSVVKPRVSTDKDGLEAEIKITGCQPDDIRFEKRYGTLIVIGVANPALPTTPIEHKSSIQEKRASSHGKELTRSKGLAGSKANANLHQVGTSSAIVAATALGTDNLDEIHELVNIFVPKNVSINQVFISAPDAKGRIFVKGP